MNVESRSESSRIAELNDSLRRCAPLLPKPHLFVLTEGVRGLAEEQLADLFIAVRNFDAFEESNDPYGEHDFGCIVQHGNRYFFKYDYYDKDFKFHKENGVRVLTLMEAGEY